MRLMIVGANNVYNLENYYVKYLREFGIEVYHFFAQSIFYEYYRKNVINKIIFKSGFSGIYATINDEFKKEIDSFKPEIIWVFKGLEISPQSLQWAKERGIWLVNYNADNPFDFAGKGSGNTYLTNSIGLYDLHFTYYEWIKNKIEHQYGVKSVIIPFGFGINNELYERCSKEEEIVKACFLGNADKYRAGVILELANRGIKIDLYGNSWNKFISHPNIEIFGPLYEDDFWLTLRRYRVQLNLMRPHNLNAHNMRSFEIPAVGGIQLALETDDHKKYFQVNKEIFLYTDVEDCRKKINQLLLLDEVEAQRIRQQARERSVSSGYSYKSRTEAVAKEIRLLIA